LSTSFPNLDADDYGDYVEADFALQRKTGARAVSRPFCYVKPSAINIQLSAFVLLIADGLSLTA
jgi:hypothetical protein